MKSVLIGTAAVVLVIAAVAVVPSIRAQTRDRGGSPGEYLPLGAGSEVGVSVRELASEEVSRAKLDRAGGVLVQSVCDGSPAARAGFRGGDIIVEFDGERIRGVRHFSRLVRETPAGRTVRAAIVREGTRQTLEVTPEAAEQLSTLLPEIRREIERGMRSLPRDLDLYFPGQAARGRLGVTLVPLSDQLASYFGVKEGVLVSAVEPASPAAQAGIRAADVITAIDGVSMRTPADVAARARTEAPGAALEVHLVRDKQQMVVKLVLPERQPRQIPI